MQLFYIFRKNNIKQFYSFLRMPRRKASSIKKPAKKAKLENEEVATKATKDLKTELNGTAVIAPIHRSSNDDSVNEKTNDGRSYNLKVVSWNVAGVRAWVKKLGHNWLNSENPDIICLQEVKCEEKEIPQPLKDMTNYKIFWNASKSMKGFSGVALLSKTEPLDITYGISVKEHDQEGRTITAEYEKFFLVTTYVPNSQRGLKRLEYRMKWNSDFKDYILSLDAKKPVILCGDMNVSHLEIDLANPKQNKRSAGFTQEERDGMSELLESGFVDTFRHIYPDLTKKYTFWTYMGNARAKNVGWRLDYFIVSKRWVMNLCDNVMASSIMGSDHCPIMLYFALPSHDITM